MTFYDQRKWHENSFFTQAIALFNSYVLVLSFFQFFLLGTKKNLTTFANKLHSQSCCKSMSFWFSRVSHSFILSPRPLFDRVPALLWSDGFISIIREVLKLWGRGNTLTASDLKLFWGKNVPFWSLKATTSVKAAFLQKRVALTQVTVINRIFYCTLAKSSIKSSFLPNITIQTQQTIVMSFIPSMARVGSALCGSIWDLNLDLKITDQLLHKG